MNKAIVVDDDIAVLQFLHIMIPWEQLGFELTATCTNAQDALDVCGRAMPDLVITDIGMPGMNGLELIRNLKNGGNHSRFLILSCHDEFRFAQQAVQLGVQDYVLKETLDVDNIKEAIGRISQQIEEDAELRMKVEKLHQQAVQTKPGFKESWLREWLTTPLVDQQSWNRQVAEFGIPAELDHYIPVVCSVFKYHEALLRYNSENMLKYIMDNALEELIRSQPNAILFAHNAKDYCILLACRKDIKQNPYEQIEHLCRLIQHSLAKILKLQVSVLIGEIAKESDAMKKQYTQLLQLSGQSFFYSGQTEMARAAQVKPLNLDEELLPYYSEYADQINRIILEGSRAAETAVDPFIAFITERRFQPSKVKTFLLKLMLDVQIKLTFTHQYNNEKMQRELENISNVDELKKWMLRCIDEAILLMEQISSQKKKTEIMNAQKYIQLHLHRKIALEEVADHLFLNASYFSRLFKKEMGENFVEYVTRLKMEKAKEMMSDANSTVESVAHALGYDNKSYFVKLFKKHYGVPPSLLT